MDCQIGQTTTTDRIRGIAMIAKIKAFFTKPLVKKFLLSLLTLKGLSILGLSILSCVPGTYMWIGLGGLLLLKIGSVSFIFFKKNFIR